MSTIHMLWWGRSCQTSRAKMKSPILPIAAPAASILASLLDLLHFLWRWRSTLLRNQRPDLFQIASV